MSEARSLEEQFSVFADYSFLLMAMSGLPLISIVSWYCMCSWIRRLILLNKAVISE